jgi:NADH:ubiquinone oxidoreductase subunit 2 (subunit N)
LPVIMAMYMKAPASDTAHVETRAVGAARWVIGVTAALLLLFGVWPNPVLNLAREESRQLRPAVLVTVSR